MANPKPSNSLKPGHTFNPTGVNQHTNAIKPKRLVDEIAVRCLKKAFEIIAHWEKFALSEDPKVAYLYGKDLLDRGMGKAKQYVEVQNTDGSTMSSPQILTILEDALKQQEANDLMAKEILELKEQIKWLNEKPVKE